MTQITFKCLPLPIEVSLAKRGPAMIPDHCRFKFMLSTVKTVAQVDGAAAWGQFALVQYLP